MKRISEFIKVKLFNENNSEKYEVESGGLTRNFSTMNSFKNERSLFIFSYSNKLRKICIDLAKSQKFEYLILFLIIISSILLAMESPLDNSYSTKT